MVLAPKLMERHTQVYIPIKPQVSNLKAAILKKAHPSLTDEFGLVCSLPLQSFRLDH